jgi:hypothetical protein
MQRQKEFTEGTDAVNSVAMSLSDDRDSMHTARSTHDNVQSTFGNEAYGESEGWHEELYLYLWIGRKVFICVFPHPKKSVEY